ncbi:phosphatase PAP2 family protein [Streptomyces pactum]|uniref:phosphatase PAP2 family protein n=1 Tax=Streptomyces pactum TaxID=68249 RepID=UPI0027DBF8EE|nr:phosphatase PAP2 family protein [Streptomyces pactum]
MTWQVAVDGPLRGMDERAGRAAGGRLLPGAFAEFLADLGGTAVALPVLGAAAAYTARRLRRVTPRWWLPPLSALLALAVVPALVAPVKALLDRPAPPGPLAGTDGFYPSGHTATATVAYGAAAMLLLAAHRARAADPSGRRGHRPSRRGPVVAGVTVTLLSTGVGTGLVVRGYHWPLDVAGSWCLSAALLTVLSLTMRRWLVPRG